MNIIQPVASGDAISGRYCLADFRGLHGLRGFLGRFCLFIRKDAERPGCVPARSDGDEVFRPESNFFKFVGVFGIGLEIGLH